VKGAEGGQSKQQLSLNSQQEAEWGWFANHQSERTLGLDLKRHRSDGQKK